MSQNRNQNRQPLDPQRKVLEQAHKSEMVGQECWNSFNLTVKQVGNLNNAGIGMILVYHVPASMLFDSGVSYCLISSIFVHNMNTPWGTKYKMKHKHAEWEYKF